MACSSTRSVSRHSVFGDPKELCMNMIPTGTDVFKAYLHHQRCDKKLGVMDISRIVAEEVVTVYQRASIPTIEFNSIVKKVQRLIEKGRDLKKYPVCKRTSSAFQESMTSLSELFDVCACKCYDHGAQSRTECRCPLDSKIPAMEWEFWKDQKSCRQMVIGNTDKTESKKIRKRLARKLQDEARTICSPAEGTGQCNTHEDAIYEETDEEEDKQEESSYEEDAEEATDEGTTSQNRNRYPELCKAVERANVSNRDVCLIVNGVLKDLGILSSTNTLDPSKLKRQRKYWRERSVEEHRKENEGIVCMGFDGKIDETLAADGIIHRKVKEEHYVLVSFPKGRYVDHIHPDSAKAADVSNEIFSVIAYSKSQSTLRAVVCDGSAVNTGMHNGVIRRMELHLQRPLQWFICMLHANELPFRKLVNDICGRTTGPKSCDSSISQMLEFDPLEKPIIPFVPIPGRVVSLEDSVVKDLSTDQLYLLRICQLVQRGMHGEEDNVKHLQTAQPGALNHARWLTKANRFLRLYTSQRNPSEDLVRIVRFILNFYAPSWFYIKSHPTGQHGARNFFFILTLYQQLDAADQGLVAPVLLNNSYFCHPENLLLAAVADDEASTRAEGCDRIIQARLHSTGDSIRCFNRRQIKVNLEATSYMEMIDWESTTVTPPPLLDEFDSNYLEEHPQIILPFYPCHSQDVERNVKDVTVACQRFYGHDTRHGAILQTKKSRQEIPVIEKKADFL